MNDPVLCPWCNQPMKAVALSHYKTWHEKRFTGECWCTSCQAVSPIAEGKDGNGYATRERAKEAAVKIALKRYEPGKEEKDNG